MKVLYVAPSPGERGGIADYAERFRLALDVAGVAVVTSPREADLAHVELGTNSVREFDAARALQRSGMPVVLTVHEPEEVVARAMAGVGSRVLARALNPVGVRRTRRLVERAAAVLALGPTAAARFAARWHRPAAAIPHVSYGGPRAHAGGEPVRVLYAGFFGPGKGLDVLAEAFAGVDATLVVAGAEFVPGQRDPIADVLARFPRLEVERTGFLPPDAFAALFASCQVGVVPYLATVPGGSSGILMRSLGAGLATVCSDTPALAQDVEHETTGLVVPAGDAAALGAALRRLEGDPALRQRLGDAAASHMADAHAPETVGAAVSAVYASAV